MKSAKQARMFLETFQTEAFNGCYDKIWTIKLFDFCLSRTLRVIFKWLINSARWIITGERLIHIYRTF